MKSTIQGMGLSGRRIFMGIALIASLGLMACNNQISGHLGSAEALSGDGSGDGSSTTGDPGSGITSSFGSYFELYDSIDDVFVYYDEVYIRTVEGEVYNLPVEKRVMDLTNVYGSGGGIRVDLQDFPELPNSLDVAEIGIRLSQDAADRNIVFNDDSTCTLSVPEYLVSYATEAITIPTNSIVFVKFIYSNLNGIQFACDGDDNGNGGHPDPDDDDSSSSDDDSSSSDDDSHDGHSHGHHGKKKGHKKNGDRHRYKHPWDSGYGDHESKSSSSDDHNSYRTQECSNGDECQLSCKLANSRYQIDRINDISDEF